MSVIIQKHKERHITWTLGNIAVIVAVAVNVTPGVITLAVKTKPLKNRKQTRSNKFVPPSVESG